MKLKLLCFVMTHMMLASLMISCDNGNSTTQNEQTGDLNYSTDSVITEEKPPVFPDELKYDGETFLVLSAGNVAYNDFNYTSEDVSILGQAQYKRKTIVQEQFDIEIELQVNVDKNSKGGGPGYKKIQSAVSSNDTIYHLGIIGGYDVAALASDNFLYDINSLEYVDTSKSWWDQNANNDLTINGMLFFTNGSLTGAYSESTFVIYYNKVLGEQKEITDIYQVVKDGKWTIDKLAEYSRMVSEDLDGDGKKGPKDRYGIYVWDDSILGMIGAAGAKCATVSSDGKIELTLYSETTVNAFNKFTDIAYDKEYALTYQRYTSTGQMSSLDSWANNQALFWASSNGNTSLFRDMESDYGILPYPKLNEDQERYYSTIAPYNSQFICVPLIQEDTVFVGAVTEALAYHGKQIVWPALFEQTLKGSFARDEGTFDMLDIIYSTYGYDIGYYYMVGNYQSNIMNLLRSYDTSFNSMYETYKQSAETQLKMINDGYARVLEEWAK